MLDYEAEYNNRARVPEHAEIFARWTREAQAFRAEASAERRAELGLGYGTGPRQIIDLFAPAGGTQAPLAMFVHGGYWRSLEPQMFSHMARGLNARGVCVAVAGYDLCPQVRITDIVGQIRQASVYLWHRFGRRVLVSGHSAGGHLAACMLATDWKALAPDAPADLVACAYSLSGVFDLAPLRHVSMNADLRLDEAEAQAMSPLAWPVAPGRVLDAVVGGDEFGGISAPEPQHRRSVAAERSGDPVRGSAGHEPLHRARRDGGPGQCDGGAPRRARRADAGRISIPPPPCGGRVGERSSPGWGR